MKALFDMGIGFIRYVLISILCLLCRKVIAEVVVFILPLPSLSKLHQQGKSIAKKG